MASHPALDTLRGASCNSVMFQESGLTASGVAKIPGSHLPFGARQEAAQPLCGANTIIADPHKRAFRTLFYGAP